MDTKRSVTDVEEEIDLRELYYLFLQKLKVIILMGVIGGILSGAFTYFFIAPKYEATARIYVVSASSDSVVNLSDLQIGTNLTSDYKELILSRPMLESAIHNLHLDMTTDELLGMLDVVNPSGTRILEITATSTERETARDIANEMARLAISWLPEVMESNEPNIAEEAVLPEHRSSPSYTKNTVLGGIVLAVLYFGVCVVRHLADDTITSSEIMEKYFGIVPLTVIPEEKEMTTAKEEMDKRKKRLAGRSGGGTAKR